MVPRWLRAKSWTLLFGVGAFLLLLMPARPAFAALHNVNGWAWSGTTGWISTNCEDAKPGYPTGDCALANNNYGLDIANDGSVSGWAWSTQAGWICVGATCNGAGGVPPGGTPTNDHFCSGHMPCAGYLSSDGQLHGWAYIVSQTDGANYRGWVSLNCTDVDPNTAAPRNCGVSDYSVNFDSGGGNIYGYAWNANGDQTGNGWIQFACGFPRPCVGASGDWGVTTSWVLSNWSSISPIEGVYTSNPPPATGSSLTTFNIVFNNISAPANSTLSCSFNMSNTGNYRQVSWPIVARLSNAPTLTETYTVSGGDALADGSGNPVPWTFSAPPGPTPYGCQIIGTPPVKKTVVNLVYVHPPAWTFNGPADVGQSDAKQAKSCLDGTLGIDPNTAYFMNTAQCDTEGDLAFTLLKAKGVKVQLNCRSAADDDGNGQPGNCVPGPPDRNCRGITWLCISHPSPLPGGAGPPQP